MNFVRVCGASASLAAAVSYCSYNYVNESEEKFNGLHWKGILPVQVHACETKKLRLEQVQILFRHGARTPIKSYKDFENLKNFPAIEWDRNVFMHTPSHLDVEFLLSSLDNGEMLKPFSYPLPLLGGCKGGDLTTKGQLEGYEFGTWVAQEYIAKHGFLSPTYVDDGSLYIRSTHTHRTVFTARAVVAGIYGKENILQPVQMYAKKKKDDICPNWSECYKINRRLMHYWYEVKHGQKELNELMGLADGARLMNFIAIHDIISQLTHHGFPVPDKVLEQREFAEEQAMVLIGQILGDDEDGLRSSIGSLLEILCSEIEAKISGESKRKVGLYASHDTTILCIQKVLGIFEGVWPGYVSSIIFELYVDEESGKRFVRVLFDRKVLRLVDDNEFIPVEMFLNWVEKYRVLDWNDECGNNSVGAVLGKLH